MKRLTPSQPDPRRFVLCTRTGFGLLEILIDLTILALVTLAIVDGIQLMHRQTVSTDDKAFAIQKAIQMMEELRLVSIKATNSSLAILDPYDDHNVNNKILTTKSVTDPADPISDNARLRYGRQITVAPLASDPVARQVYVRVYRASTQELLAETMSVLRVPSRQYVPTQVYDLYVLAIENLPGWWSNLGSIKGIFKNLLQDFHFRNPALEFRVHWITRLAYGRDPYYAPYINNTTYMDQTAFPYVYLYPGKFHDPGGADVQYYLPNLIHGRFYKDDQIQNWDSPPLDIQYSLADQFNHAVRYPEELTLFAAATTYMTLHPNLQTPEITEISLRMLLEQMNQPGLLQNAIIVNLHGETLPVPPMRNYSDAAKDPVGEPSLRVVTHPENLQYATGSGVNLRVYAYVSSTTWAGVIGKGVDNTPETTVIPNITVLLKGVNVIPSAIRYVEGDSLTHYQWQNATGAKATVTTGSGTAPQTLIRLKDTPVRHAANPDGTGLGMKLYGMEYVPCPIGSAFAANADDLTTAGGGPKNTARWVIEIPASALPNGQWTVETRIGTDLGTGSPSNQPSDLSRTYVWVGVPPPVTEQFQFLGDPRHMPYADAKATHQYNWFFANLADPAQPLTYVPGYTGFTKARGLFQTDDQLVDADLPRFFQVFRSGILAGGHFLTQMNGQSYCYLGLGGLIGKPSANVTAGPGLPVIAQPWSPGSTASTFVDEITGGQLAPQSGQRLIRAADNSWTSLPWLGELYPDDHFGDWSLHGNLPATGGPGQPVFYREPFYAASDLDPSLSLTPKIRAHNLHLSGGPTMTNGNPSGDATSAFGQDGHISNNGINSSLLNLQLSPVFKLSLPPSIKVCRAFRLDNPDMSFLPPTQYGDSTYTSQQTKTTMVESPYYAGEGSYPNGVGLVAVAASNQVGYFFHNGLCPQYQVGAYALATISLVGTIRGFLAAGVSSSVSNLGGHVPQLPLITVVHPSVSDQIVNPTSIDISWTRQWLRWDGQPYTEDPGYAGYIEPAGVVYNVKYSGDGGVNWFLLDGVPVQAGVRNPGHDLPDLPVLSASWTTPAPLVPAGSYLVRVEAFRPGVPQHYSYHVAQIYIHRD